MTAKKPKRWPSVRSEAEAEREGKSELCVVAMNAGNAAGAKAERCEKTSWGSMPRH